MSGPGREVWASGDSYEPYVGRWGRLVSVEFLAWLNVQPGWHWLDGGCGTGALSAAPLARCELGQVGGIDPSGGYIARARDRVQGPRIRFELAVDREPRRRA
jgi:ubiquinone/menaquinone biosynthesis C-methylase UbiE